MYPPGMNAFLMMIMALTSCPIFIRNLGERYLQVRYHTQLSRRKTHNPEGIFLMPDAPLHPLRGFKISRDGYSYPSGAPRYFYCGVL